MLEHFPGLWPDLNQRLRKVMKMVTQKAQEIKPEEFVNAILQGTNAQAAEVLKAGGKLKTIPGFEEFVTSPDVSEFCGITRSCFSGMVKKHGIVQELYPEDVKRVHYCGNRHNPLTGIINLREIVEKRNDIKVSYPKSINAVSLCHTGCAACDQVIIPAHSYVRVYTPRAILSLIVMTCGNSAPKSTQMARVYEAFLASDYVRAIEESGDIDHVKAGTPCTDCSVEFHKDEPAMTRATKLPGMPEEHHAEVIPHTPENGPLVTAVGFSPELIQLIIRTAINESVDAIVRHTRGV